MAVNELKSGLGVFDDIYYIRLYQEENINLVCQGIEKHSFLQMRNQFPKEPKERTKSYHGL